MATILRGTSTPLIQRYGEKWSPSTGFARNYVYKNFDEAQMRAQFQAFINAGVEAQISSSFGVWELEAIDTTGEVTIDKWEVNIDEEQPSALQNPRNIANVDDASVMDVLAVALRDGLSLAEAHAKIAEDTGGTYTAPPYNAYTKRLFERMMAGQTQYQSSRMILRHTTNAPARYQSNIADLGVNMLYTHADLLSECLSGSLWVYPLPGALEYALTYFYNTYSPTSKSNYLWSWLKSGSPRVTAANNRVDISTQFKLDQWSTDEYETY